MFHLKFKNIIFRQKQSVAPPKKRNKQIFTSLHKKSFSKSGLIQFKEY